MFSVYFINDNGLCMYAVHILIQWNLAWKTLLMLLEYGKNTDIITPVARMTKST